MNENASSISSLKPHILCPICAKTPTELRFHITSSHLSQRVIYSIRGCQACGHHFACGPTDDTTMALVYGQGFHATSQQEGLDAKSPVMVNAQRRVAQLAAVGMQGRLLDIGAGKGYFVEAAAKHFQAIGIEYSPTAAAAARAAGRAVLTGSFPEQSPCGPFDVITLWDALAGFSEPHAAIRSVQACLAFGGHIVLTVPLVSAPMARWFGRYWPLWIPPVNLHYFTLGSIRVLMQTHGLKIIAMRTESKRVAFDFLMHKALRAVGLRRLACRLHGVLPSWSVDLNLGDIVTIYARKSPVSTT